MEMRELTRLFLCFKSLVETTVTFEDMYTTGNLAVLREAITKLCTSEGGEKPGLKVNLNSIFQRSLKILKGYYAESSQISRKKQLKSFKETYDFNLPEIIVKARYYTEKKTLGK